MEQVANYTKSERKRELIWSAQVNRRNDKWFCADLGYLWGYATSSCCLWWWYATTRLRAGCQHQWQRLYRLLKHSIKWVTGHAPAWCWSFPQGPCGPEWLAENFHERFILNMWPPNFQDQLHNIKTSIVKGTITDDAKVNLLIRVCSCLWGRIEAILESWVVF